VAPRCPCDQGSPRVALQRVMSDTATPYIAADGPWEIIHDCQMTILSRVAAPKIRALTTSPPLKWPSRPSASCPHLHLPTHQPRNVEYSPCLKGLTITKVTVSRIVTDLWKKIHGLTNLVNTTERIMPKATASGTMSELSKATESAFKTPFWPDRASSLS
jgi:hypothetical protein